MSLLSQNASRKPEGKIATIWETVRTLGYAVALALVFRSLLFEPFHIPSGSMRATLLEGDYIFVSKYSYGYSRYSFPFGAKLDFFSGRLASSMPKRGDVLVFRLPTDPSIDYIKRVIGLPGDKVQVKDGKVYLNGEKLKYKMVEEFAFNEDGVARRMQQWRETMPGGQAHRILNETNFGNVDNTDEYVVPPGYYFMMGDNRDNSIDSRYQKQVGFVSDENLIGRAEIILFSLDGLDDFHFWQVWRYPSVFRADRFFKAI